MLPASLLASIFASVELNHLGPLNYVITGGFILITGFGLFYICIGRLTVKLENQILTFIWDRKALFNYQPIAPVHLDNIRTLVINEQVLLKELQTDERQIPIGTAKLLKKDATEFIDFLKTNTNAEQIDSWDVWKRRGWLAIAYRINSFILIVLGIFVIGLLSIKGFSSSILFIIPLLIFQLVAHQLMMRSKM